VDLQSKIFVTGHAGLVGSAIVRNLKKNGYENIITATKQELDLRNQQTVEQWFSENRPEYVFLAAGKVGGILANSTFPAQFLYDNLLIVANTLEASRKQKVKKLLYLGSSCIYPKFAIQPIVESQLLSGQLEPTNEAYAIAKIAGIKLCDSYRSEYGCNFISAMPTNLYGIGDNFSEQSSHVIPAMIRKFHEAKLKNESEVTIWGTGTPLREFLHVDDLAEACRFLMLKYDLPGPINVGVGVDISIHDLATMIQKIVHKDCEIKLDVSKPDGTPRKCLDISRITSLGWNHKIALLEGLQSTYKWYLENLPSIRSKEL
jgi:GDP-L-fucose synthase